MNDYITTEELKREIEKLGLEHKSGAFCLYIEDNGHPVANIDLYQPLQVDTCYDTLNYKNPTHLNLYSLLDRYARTPIEKREEEKKYRLRLDVNNKIENNWQILGKNRNDGAYHIGLGRGSDKWQTTFTQAEIDAMGDLVKGFVKEEV